MKKNKNILGNLYCKIATFPCFKGMVYGHMSYNFYSDNHSINRKYYRITDLELWCKSDFKEGEKLIIRRISEKGKYNFRNQWC